MVKSDGMSREKFRDWLDNELKIRGMKPADLARRGEISPSIISRIMGLENAATNEACKKIARGLNLPVEVVLKEAELLPVTLPVNRQEQEIVNLIRQLSPSQRDTVLQMLDGLSDLPGPLSIETYNEALGQVTTDLTNRIKHLFELLDQYRQRQVYEYLLWQLRSQAIDFNSSGITPLKREEWRKAIETIDLLLTVHASTPEAWEQAILLAHDVLSRNPSDESGPGEGTLPPGSIEL